MLQWSTSIDSRIQSVSSGIGYLLLALHQMGLGATWMTGPISQAKGDIEKILNVPSDIDIIAMVPSATQRKISLDSDDRLTTSVRSSSKQVGVLNGRFPVE